MYKSFNIATIGIITRYCNSRKKYNYVEKLADLLKNINVVSKNVSSYNCELQ